jgi:hypothetical protein
MLPSQRGVGVFRFFIQYDAGVVQEVCDFAVALNACRSGQLSPRTMDAFHPYEYAPVSGDCVCKSVGSAERANEFKGKGSITVRRNCCASSEQLASLGDYSDWTGGLCENYRIGNDG